MAGSSQNGVRRGGAIALVVASVALLVVAIVRFSAGDESSTRVETLPVVDLTGANEAVVSTSELVGGPLVINFWYTACPPCANELQHFAAVDEKYGDRVRFVGVNAIDTVEEMIEFASERGVDYEMFQDRLAELQTDLRLTSFPTTLFVTADGTIIERTGVLDESSLEAEVSALLEASVPSQQ